MQSPILPSPLCAKELEEIIFSAGSRSPMNGNKASYSEVDDEVDAELKMNSCLPCWTSSDLLTNEVKCSLFCMLYFIVFMYLLFLNCFEMLPNFNFLFCPQRWNVLVRALIRRELNEIMQLVSKADLTEVTVALEHFIDKVLTIVKARNDLDKK